jgi:hypothetical protein
MGRKTFSPSTSALTTPARLLRKTSNDVHVSRNIDPWRNRYQLPGMKERKRISGLQFKEVSVIGGSSGSKAPGIRGSPSQWKWL